MRWCEENTMNFVKLYLSKECLWNPSHEWYKTKFEREIAYSEIIEEFATLTGKCMTIPEVKTKIKNLRSTYTQQVQKILIKSSPDTIYKPSLIWFHEMDRRLKYVPNTKTTVADFVSKILIHACLVTVFDHHPLLKSYIYFMLAFNKISNRWHLYVFQSQEALEMDSDEAAWPHQDKTLASTFEEESSDPLNPLLYTDNEYDTVATQRSAIQVKIEEDSFPEYSNMYLKRKKRKLKKPPQFIQSQIKTWYKDDEFDIYGKYIASQLRKMELQSALQVQLEIQNLMKEAMTSASEY